uniref:Uncharacterized protein n=1 Tax=Rhizophagus irregularis (strain DAOM 181602 / DAOM 197198 / MUCL 43194) TaxID=747089 RepID=U9TSJ5_RHIID
MFIQNSISRNTSFQVVIMIAMVAIKNSSFPYIIIYPFLERILGFSSSNIASSILIYSSEPP